MKDYLEDNKLILTLNHANVVERLIRTLKSMIYKRIGAAEQNDGEVKR